MASAWRNFKNISSRPLFTNIFRPEILKFHPYSILIGETMVKFVIYCVLRGHSCSFRTNLVSFRTFRRPLFSKPVFCPGLFFATSYSKTALVEPWHYLIGLQLELECLQTELKLNTCLQLNSSSKWGIIPLCIKRQLKTQLMSQIFQPRKIGASGWHH